MSHKEQLKAIEIMKNSLISTKRFNILEIGSYDVNGAIRDMFNYEKYFGVDLCPGPNVDVIGSGHTINLVAEDINLCISSECFEHNPFWKETLENMARHLKGGGFIVVTTAINGRLEHGTLRTNPKHSPGSTSIGWSYYKNINPSEFKSFIEKLPGYKESFVCTQSITFDLYAVILINDSTDYKIDTENLKKLYKLKILNLSFKSLLFQFWLLPMRFLSYFINDKKYMDIGVKYEKITKGFIHKIISKTSRK
jgi:SAM-dependent methyltransferase